MKQTWDGLLCCAAAILLVSFFSTSLLAQAGGAAAGGTVATGPVYRVLRSVAGTSTVQQNGRVVVQDTRSIFYVPQDRQVVVYFEWQGPAGRHHFEGVWKDPAGNPSVLSNFDFDATQTQFGGYWTLLLTDQTAPGFWTLQARIDGEDAGTHTIEVRNGAKPADTKAARQMLTTSQVYARAAGATVGVEAVNDSGDRIDNGAGVVIADGEVATVFNVIDGASAINLILPGGQRQPVAGILAYSRWQDWVVLKAPGVAAKPLPPAPKDSISVGDHEYVMAWKDGAATILEATLAGRRDDPRNGTRYSLGSNGTPDPGSPVINDFGELVGIYGAVRYPGMGTPRNFFRLGSNGLDVSGNTAEVIPLADLPRLDGVQPHALAELADSGAFLPPLTKLDDLLQGWLARDATAKPDMISIPRASFEFSRMNPRLVVSLLWNPRTNLKGLVTFDLYDLDNHLLTESKPLKVSMHKGTMAVSNWTLNISAVTPAIYRADVRLGPRTIWRAFFRVTP